MSKHYDIKLTGGDKVLITDDEVAGVIKAKAEGLEFVRIRDNFLNPKYIVSITPNYYHESNGPGMSESNPIRLPNQKVLKAVALLKAGVIKRLK